MSTNSQFENFRPLDAQLIKDVEKVLSKLNISIYKKVDDELFLIRLGSHLELFNK